MNGSLIAISVALSVATSGNYLVPFDVEEFDIGNWFDPMNSTAFTVPAGVEYVRVGANVTFNSVASGLNARVFISKNGSLNYNGRPAQTAVATSGQQPRISLSGLVPVTEGDTFEVSVQIAGATSYNISHTNTNFWIEEAN